MNIIMREKSDFARLHQKLVVTAPDTTEKLSLHHIMIGDEVGHRAEKGRAQLRLHLGGDAPGRRKFGVQTYASSKPRPAQDIVPVIPRRFPPADPSSRSCLPSGL